MFLGLSCRVSAWESAKTHVLFPVDAAPLAKHLVSPMVSCFPLEAWQKAVMGVAGALPGTVKACWRWRQSLPTSVTSGPAMQMLAVGECLLARRPKVSSMPSESPKAPQASFWVCRFHFSAFSRKLKWVGREGSQAWGRGVGSLGLVPSCPAR